MALAFPGNLLQPVGMGHYPMMADLILCSFGRWVGREEQKDGCPTYTVEEQGPLCRSKPLQEGPLRGHWSMAVAPPGSLEHRLVYWPWVVGPRKQSRTEVVVVELVGLDFEW